MLLIAGFVLLGLFLILINTEKSNKDTSEYFLSKIQLDVYAGKRLVKLKDLVSEKWKYVCMIGPYPLTVHANDIDLVNSASIFLAENDWFQSEGAWGVVLFENKKNVNAKIIKLIPGDQDFYGHWKELGSGNDEYECVSVESGYIEIKKRGSIKYLTLRGG